MTEQTETQFCRCDESEYEHVHEDGVVRASPVFSPVGIKTRCHDNPGLEHEYADWDQALVDEVYDRMTELGEGELRVSPRFAHMLVQGREHYLARFPKITVVCDPSVS